jgi:hypothetical protein
MFMTNIEHLRLLTNNKNPKGVYQTMAAIKILEYGFEQQTGTTGKAFSALSSNDYSSVEFTSGYGSLSSAGATVQKGVTGHISVDLTITSYSEDSYQQVMNEITNTVSKDVHDQLQEHLKERDYGNWWTKLLGIGSGHDVDHYKDEDHASVEITDTTIKNSLEKHMSGSSQSFSIKGEFDITGQSDIPTTVYLFIKTLQIQTSSGTTNVVSNQTAAADSQGNIQPSSGKLNIITLK